MFDSNGSVVAGDSKGTLLEDLRTYLQYAASKNVFVTLTLWNGALMRDSNYQNLITDKTKT
jgi:hypothetical protein